MERKTLQLELVLSLAVILHFAYGATDYKRCYLEAAWGPWRCPGEEQRCTAKNATRYRCIGGNCTVVDPCATLPGFQESKSCKLAVSQGQCVPWWASWSSWTQCSAVCGYMESSRYRPCIGAWSVADAPPEVKTELYRSCAVNTRAHEGVNTRDCQIRRLCPNINGGWGEWSAFTPCSVTCGTGYRHRMRACNRPARKGNGLPCQGIDTQSIPCDASVPCPRRGEWCPWSNTITHCSHSCGPKGMGLRTRLCACPKPSHGGENCQIPLGAEESAHYEASKKGNKDIPQPDDAAILAIRTGQGRWESCNRHPCPYLKFLKEEEEVMLIQDLLIQRAEDTWTWSSGQPSKEGEPVQLHCPASRQSRLNVFDKPERFPQARAYWTKSVPKSASVPIDLPGTPLTADREMLIEGDRLTIRSLLLNMTGVYRFGYEYEPGYFETVCFFIVYIRDGVWNISHGQTIDLTCNALGLWPVISKPGLGTWSVYWEVLLDNQAKDTKHNTRWWYTDLMRHISEDELLMLNQTENDTARAALVGSGLTLWDTEYRRIYRTTAALNGRYTCVLYNKINTTHNRTFYVESLYLHVSDPPSIVALVISVCLELTCLSVKAWCVRNYWHLVTLAVTGLVSSVICALCLWRRSQNIARLEIQSRELAQTRKAINLAELDAKID